jgi:hypothetical protein
MKIQVVQDPRSHKVGINEVVGLNKAMRDVMTPIQALIKDKVYWNDCDLDETEYKSRDGFIPYSHNQGGIQLSLVIPSCEKDGFDHLIEFGECDECGNAELYPEGDHQCGYKGQECGYESEGHLDAHFRVWLKFEGIDQDTQELSFYLYCGGGNGDAPYFRTKYEADVFEASFTCKSVAGLKRSASKHVQALIAKIKGGAQ